LNTKIAKDKFIKSIEQLGVSVGPPENFKNLSEAKREAHRAYSPKQIPSQLDTLLTSYKTQNLHSNSSDFR
jgi:hypothetical protein